jgi:thiamine-phosphate pyrophosphorylase
MDEKLAAWARAVKARQRQPRGRAVLWLFTDAARLADPFPVLRLLPPGLGGVVLRDDGLPGREALGRRIARLCRRRRLALSVAGDWRLAAALHAGLHLRGGRLPPCTPRWLPRLTSSAHAVPDLLRARRAGVAVAFLSPVFATASHPGAHPLGPLRWGLAARRSVGAGALGGIDGCAVQRLPRRLCHGAGAVGALYVRQRPDGGCSPIVTVSRDRHESARGVIAAP